MKIINDERIDPRIRALPGYEEAKRRIELVREYITLPKPIIPHPPEEWIKGN